MCFLLTMPNREFLFAAPSVPTFTPDFVQLASGDMSNTQLGISPVSLVNIDYYYGWSEEDADLARSLGTGLWAIDLAPRRATEIPAQMRRQFFHTFRHFRWALIC